MRGRKHSTGKAPAPPTAVAMDEGAPKGALGALGGAMSALQAPALLMALKAGVEQLQAEGKLDAAELDMIQGAPHKPPRARAPRARVAPHSCM